MAIIINDFEVAVEAPPTAAPGEGPAPSEKVPPSRPLSPQDVADVMRWHHDRLARVDAT